MSASSVKGPQVRETQPSIRFRGFAGVPGEDLTNASLWLAESSDSRRDGHLSDTRSGACHCGASSASGRPAAEDLSAGYVFQSVSSRLFFRQTPRPKGGLFLSFCQPGLSGRSAVRDSLGFSIRTPRRGVRIVSRKPLSEAREPVVYLSETIATTRDAGGGFSVAGERRRRKDFLLRLWDFLVKPAGCGKRPRNPRRAWKGWRKAYGLRGPDRTSNSGVRFHIEGRCTYERRRRVLVLRSGLRMEQ